MSKLFGLLLCLLISGSLFATPDTFRVIRSGKLNKVTSVISDDLTVEGELVLAEVTIAADTATPNIAEGNIFVTSANTGATAILEFAGETAGKVIYLVGGSDTNPTTIADSGYFALSAAFVASANNVLVLYIQGDDDYIELSRSEN